MTSTRAPIAGTDVSPGRLIKMTIADCGAKVLHSAVQLGVFTALADGPLDAAAVAEAAGIHARLAVDFLDTLVGFDLLARDGELYANTPIAEAYLVKDEPGYLGGFIELTDETLYTTWGRLTEALRTGEPQRLDPDKGGFFGDKHQDPERMKRFLKGLDAYSDRMGAELADRIDWSAYGSFVDVGGARGNLSAVLVQAHPHLAATTFDLERTRPLFTEHVGRLGLQEQITFVGGDFFADDIPAADVVVLGHILHGFEDEQRQELLRRVAEAVKPGGKVLIYDRMIDEDRTDPERLMSSLHMKLVSENGSEYRAADCRAWLIEAGFAEASDEQFLGTHTLVVGTK